MKAIRTKLGIDPGVFYVSAAISILFVAWGVLFTENLASVAGAVLDYIIRTFGWVFVLATIGFLVFAVFLGVSRFGKIRLGQDGDRPEFRTSSWVAMMFSAGMGIGLMFFGVAEPLSHLAAPPNGAAKAGSVDAARVAMEYSYFHWALHPWALYAVVGLALAYFTYRKGMPNLISSAFYPLLGERVNGPIGKGIDTLAIFATLFGTATSLGLGAVQINSGMNFVWDVPTSNGLAIAIIAVLTLAFVVSAVSGVSRGVKWLSNTNMVLAIALLLFVLVVGPTVFIFDTLTQAIGGYLSSIVPLSFRTSAFGDREWLSTWTIFYWAWWVSWAPFVGTFIARISKGRTIGEFILGVVLVPSAVSFVWFAILGGAALNLQLTGQADIAAAVAEAPEIGLFTTLEAFPLATLTSLVVVVLVALFFVSGADAASLVMGMLSSHGAQNPARPVVILWGTLTGAAAAVLLLAGGLEALQQAAIIAAAPFVVVMIGLCVSLFKGLNADRPEAPARAPGALEVGGGAPVVDSSRGAVARP